MSDDEPRKRDSQILARMCELVGVESITNLSDAGADHNTAFTIELEDEQSFSRSETYEASGVAETERSTYRRR